MSAYLAPEPRRLHPCGQCGAALAALYPRGWRCLDCAPPPAPVPDPTRTLDALRRRRSAQLRALHRR